MLYYYFYLLILWIGFSCNNRYVFPVPKTLKLDKHNKNITKITSNQFSFSLKFEDKDKYENIEEYNY